jgi:hypothetical protein
MIGRLFSFGIGVALMSVLLGAALFGMKLMEGDSAPSEVLNRPRTAVTAVLSAQASSTPETSLAAPDSAGSVEPANPAPASPVPENPQDVVETPAPTSASDRADCAAIAGTGYRSESERLFYQANCAVLASTPTMAPPTIAPSTSTVEPPPASPVATTPPVVAPATATQTPSPMKTLATALHRQAATLAGKVATPSFNDAGWRDSTLAALQEVTWTTGAISALKPAACQATTYSSLATASSQIATAAGFIASGVDADDASLLREGGARLEAGRSALAVVVGILPGAGC